MLRLGFFCCPATGNPTIHINSRKNPGDEKRKGIPKMKKLISMILILTLALSMTATLSMAEETKTFKVGICNFVDDASLNQIVKNLQDQLAAIEAEQNVKFEILYDNCNLDFTVLNQIISKFEAEPVDLMVGIATPVAAAMQAATEDSQTPVVFAAVSDPVGSGLVESLEAPGANLTGTSDYLDTNAVMNLIFALKPEAKTIGLLYNLSEDSSTTPIAAAKAYLDEKGVAYKEYNGVNVSEVMQAAESIAADQVDAVFTPTDNTIMTAELSIYEMLKEAKIPHFTGADSFALNGAFLGYGVDYANLGKETGNMVADILINGKNPAEVPVMTFDNGTATVNNEILEALGESFEEVEALFAPYCTKVQSIDTAEEFQ